MMDRQMAWALWLMLLGVAVNLTWNGDLSSWASGIFAGGGIALLWTAPYWKRVKRPDELDGVRFLEAIDGWPRGTTGTIVHALSENHGMVEISDDDGRGLDFPVVRYDQVEVIWRLKDSS